MGKVVQGPALDFDPQEVLAPVYKFVDYQILVSANVDLGAKSIEQLVDMSKQQDGGLFFGGYGATSVVNTVNGVIAKGLDLQFTAVDYPGPAQILTSLVRGDAQYTVGAPNAVMPQVDAGHIKFLGAVADERYPQFPDVPSLREAGYQGYMPKVWNGLFTNSETPDEVLNAIAADLRELIADPAFRESLEPRISGVLQRDSTPERFRKELSEETEVWKGIFKH